MLKLLNVDAAGERALRVVAYFDQLGANEPDLAAVVRAAAVIADCPAGLELPERGVSVRYSPDGELLEGQAAAASEQRLLIGDNDEAGRVWLERSEAARELDEFIVERFAITISSVIQRLRPPSDLDFAGGFSDPALAQLFVNERASEAERSRAARLLGLQPNSRVQLIALELSPVQSLESIGHALRDSWSRPVFLSALSNQLGLAIVAGDQPVSWSGVKLELRAASGSVTDPLDAPASWLAARETLRFADAGSPWAKHLDASDLGAVRLLAHIDKAVVLADPDVVAIAKLAASNSGAEAITILDHFLHADSMRSAARETNFHHSSFQMKVTRIGKELGIDLRTPAGRQRATTALLLWKLTRSA